MNISEYIVNIFDHSPNPLQNHFNHELWIVFYAAWSWLYPRTQLVLKLAICPELFCCQFRWLPIGVSHLLGGSQVGSPNRLFRVIKKSLRLLHHQALAANEGNRMWLSDTSQRKTFRLTPLWTKRNNMRMIEHKIHHFFMCGQSGILGICITKNHFHLKLRPSSHSIKLFFPEPLTQNGYTENNTYQNDIISGSTVISPSFHMKLKAAGFFSHPHTQWHQVLQPWNRWNSFRPTNWKRIPLHETNIFAPENGWLEYDRFLLGLPIFRGEPLVSRSVPSMKLRYSTWGKGKNASSKSDPMNIFCHQSDQEKTRITKQQWWTRPRTNNLYRGFQHQNIPKMSQEFR